MRGLIRGRWNESVFGMSSVAASGEISRVVDKLPLESRPGPFPALEMDAFVKAEDDEVLRRAVSFRKTLDDISDKMRVTPVDLDWAHWRNEIATPGVVDQLKAEWESLPVPDVEGQKKDLEMELNSLFAPFLEKATELEKEAEELHAWALQEAEKVDMQIANLPSLTVEEYLDMNPDVKARVNQEIEEHQWLSI